MKLIYKTKFGRAYWANCLEVIKTLPDKSIDLVITSPPFALVRKKSYGNVPADEYVNWFVPYAYEIFRILKPRGSFVFELGGAWCKGKPARTTYHFELLLRLCKPNGPFYLAQEFYWYNPARMPAPAQWVTIERIRVKDAVTPIWWLSKTPRPKASNRRVLKPYTRSMESLLRNGYNSGARPSGHFVSSKWKKRQKGAIPSNLIISANTNSSGTYLRGCRKYGLRIHPARFVLSVPEFFINYLTKQHDLVVDPFAGSNVVGAVAERLNRRWMSVDIVKEFVIGSAFRFNGMGGRVLKRNKLR